MKIKRLIAGSLTAVAAGATIIGGALAATTFDQGMGKFVDVSSGALTSPLIVVGAGVDTTDVLGAADIAASLVSNYAVVAKAVPSAGATTGVTNGVLINSDLNKTYLGEGLSKVKAVLTETDLPDLLVKQTFTDLNSTTSTYTEKIVLNSVAKATFGVPSGESEPVLFVSGAGGSSLSTSDTPYNLTVTFIGGLDPTAVDTTYSLKLFGKDYTFGGTHTNTTLELYSATGAQTTTLSGVGSEGSVTIGGTSYTFKLSGWGRETADHPSVFLTVNGASTSPAEWVEGNTYTIPGTQVKVLVNDVSIIATGGTDKSVSAKLFVGTDKVKLVNGAAIEKNDVTKNSLVFISSTAANKINSITLQVYPDDDIVMKEGVPFTDPVFGSFKTVISGMTPGITDSSRDLIKVKADSSNVRLSLKNKDGMQYTDVPVFFGNSTGMYKQVTNQYKFWTKECNSTAGAPAYNITTNDYFVVSSGDYSYILKYSNKNYDATDPSKTYVTFTDVSTGGGTYKVYPNSEDLTIGSSTFDVNIYGDKTVCVSLDGGTGYTGAQVNITTGGGAKIDLTNAGEVLVDEMVLYSLSSGNDPSRTKFNVSASYSSSSGIRFGLTPSPDQVGTANTWKDISNYGSYVYVTGDNNGKSNVEIYNPGIRPAPANIAIGTNPVVSTVAGAAGGTYNAAVPVTNPIAKFPSEVTQTASLDKDLILVGGPCANGLVKTLLDGAWNVTDSCAAWDTTLGGQKGLIQIVEDIFGSGKKALIVAGSGAADTRSLIANKVIKPTVFTGLGAVAQYKGDVV